MDLPFSCKHGHRLIFANLHVMGFHAILNKQIELVGVSSKLGETCFLIVSFLILMFCPCSLGYRHVWFGQSILWQLKEVCGLWLPSRNIKRKTHKKRGAANDQPPHVVSPWIQSLQYILNWNPGLGIYEGGSTWRVKHHNSKALTPSGVESERWWIACSITPWVSCLCCMPHFLNRTMIVIVVQKELYTVH